MDGHFAVIVTDAVHDPLTIKRGDVSFIAGRDHQTELPIRMGTALFHYA